VLSALAFLTSWGNAPFSIAVGVAALFSLLQLSGVLGLIAGGEHGHDVDGGGDHVGDVGGEADHDVDADHDADHDPDHDADHDGENEGRGWAATALEPLGLGKIPFSMVWQSFALAFAMTGLALNARYLGMVGGAPVYTLVWTLPVATVVGYATTAAVARVFGPVFSSKGQEATMRAQLVGQMGVVISSKVDHAFGEVRIRDKTGHDLRVICKLAAGAKRVPTERQTVVVVDCEPKSGGLLVEPLDDADLQDEDQLERKEERRIV
jgi:hypothetical protein